MHSDFRQMQFVSSSFGLFICSIAQWQTSPILEICSNSLKSINRRTYVHQCRFQRSSTHGKDTEDWYMRSWVFSFGYRFFFFLFPLLNYRHKLTFVGQIAAIMYRYILSECHSEPSMQDWLDPNQEMNECSRKNRPSTDKKNQYGHNLLLEEKEKKY